MNEHRDLNVIAILANDIDKFSVLVDNLPDEVKAKYYFAVFNEERIGSKVEQISKIMESSGIEKYKVIGSKLVIKKFRDCTGCESDFLDDYTMGMNILMQWFVFKALKGAHKVLSLDDDIVITKDPVNCFDGGSGFIVDSLRKAGRSGYNEKSPDGKIIQETFKVFGQQIDVDAYFKNYINSGSLLLCIDDISIDEYEKDLVAFFESDLLHCYWMNRRIYTTYQLDEKFFTVLAIKNGICNSRLKSFVSMIIDKNEKMPDARLLNSFKKREIVHICNRNGKDVTYRRLCDLGLIKSYKWHGEMKSKMKKNRPDKDTYFLDIALAVSKRSTCLKRHYGCIIVKDGVIVATGYNGSPRGEANCCDIHDKCPRADIPHNSGNYEGCSSVHAEQNAIIMANRLDLIGATLYLVCEEHVGEASFPEIDVNYFEHWREVDCLGPCPICMRMIKNAGIKTIKTRSEETCL